MLDEPRLKWKRSFAPGDPNVARSSQPLGHHVAEGARADAAAGSLRGTVLKGGASVFEAGLVPCLDGQLGTAMNVSKSVKRSAATREAWALTPFVSPLDVSRLSSRT